MGYNFSKRTEHFTLPKQWASMRVAKKLEQETGKKIIHFEKGDYQGPDFETPEHILKATVDALNAGYVRYDPGPGLPELREYIATEIMKERRPGTKPEEVIVCAGAKNALTMTLLILPIIIIASQEAIKQVPNYYMDAALALGATKWQAVVKIILPQSIPGIVSGFILAMSRAIGESAPMIAISALVYITFLPEGPLDRFTVMPIQIYNWISQPQDGFRGLAAAGIILLLIMLLSLNSFAIFLRDYFQKRN